ncbi:hypothetical protein [Dyadobacter sp. CY356]|uniref:hypothetical protein n=1 Tax=Dyadobacter sp. CY356 TaxID=2906442 RepID=UPI001F402E32|nr:hypothetical protein [Dyadobacter sp. CY356]MCF0056854.1 hypothetical protein [Dyadobacter sp. CY356]
MSDLFDLKQARSIEAEIAIEDAKLIQKNNEPSKVDILSISKRLNNLLAPHDSFWIRWNYFAEKNGIEI